MSAPILDHSCDGIEELDNPLPRWWLYLFYATIVFSFGYAIYYPSFWFWRGTSGWTQEKQWAATAVVKSRAAVDVSLTQMAARPEVVDAGKKLFLSNCASCHGNNAEGKIGPCLTDSVWKYGSEDKSLLETIRKGRPGGMPAWGSFLKPDQVNTVASYVHSIGNTTATPANTTTPAPAESAK